MSLSTNTPQPDHTNNTDHAALAWPPLPVFSGEVLVSEDGERHQVATATITITCHDGTAQIIELVSAWGGFWHPAHTAA